MMRYLKPQTSLGLAFLACVAIGQQATPMAKPLAAIDSAMAKSVQVNVRQVIIPAPDNGATAFEQAMDALSRTVTRSMAEQAAKEEAKSFQAKLILIAWDRAQRPQAYAKVEKDYYQTVREGPRGPKANALTEQVVNEDHRLPWEYALLKPRPAQSFAGYGDPQAVAALIKIGNPKSASTGSGIFLNLLKSNQPIVLESRRQRALYLMMALPSATSLEHVLTCTEAAQKVDPEIFKRTKKQFETWLGAGTDLVYSTKWNEEIALYRKTSKDRARQTTLSSLLAASSE